MSSMIVAPQPIAIDEETGRLSGAADTGAGGMALGIDD